MTATPALVPPLRAPLARVLLGAFVLLHLLLALGSTGPTVTTIAALVLITASASIAVLAEPLRTERSAAAAVPALVACALVLRTLPVAGWPGYAAWPLGATTFVALALALRGRTGIAWLVLGALAAESLAWSLLAGAGPLPGVDLVVRHAGTLLLGTLFAVGLRRAARSVRAYREAERAGRVARAALDAAGDEQRRSAQHVLALAGPALRVLAEGSVADPGSLLALEGRLRDEVTAPALLTDRLNDALAAARRRGVDAVLLDDASSRGLPDDLRAAAADWLADRVDRTDSGRLVARVTRPLREPAPVRCSVRTDDRADVLDLQVM